MRILLLILTFSICYVCDPLPENDISSDMIMTVDSSEAIHIDFELLFNSVRIYTLP
jgi:hypothetical protein